MQPTSRQLILNLLLAAGENGQTVRATIESCALFGIRENNVRVALARLTAAGFIEPAERGVYKLGRRAVALASDVITWRRAEERVGEWSGSWVTVHVGSLGRSNRVALRARDRAMAMLGLRELDRGLHVRPDNLVGGVGEVRSRLHRLGLDEAAAVFVATDFDTSRESRARTLWDGRALTRGYRSTRRRLERWLDRAGSLDPRAAAREAYLLGNEAIRLLVFDPLLPAPLVDVDERRAFAQAVRRHDEAGRACWRRLHLVPGADSFAPSQHFDFESVGLLTRP